MFSPAIGSHRRALALAMVLVGSAMAVRSSDAPVRGPFWSGTVLLPEKRGLAAAKGLGITVGADKQTHLLYDLDTLRVAAAWTGDFLNFGSTLTKIEWPPPPGIPGGIAFETRNGPGWADAAGRFQDARPRQQGPLPKGWAHYRGLYQSGDRVVLKYTLGGVEVLESPGAGPDGTVTRTVQPLGAAPSLRVALASLPAEAALRVDGAAAAVTRPDGSPALGVQVSGAAQAKWAMEDGLLVLTIKDQPAEKPFQIALRSGGAPGATGSPADLRPLTRGGPALWTERPVTQGKPGGGKDAYVVDWITEPYPNVYNTRTFFGGFDFFPDGRAAICAFHGDVWIVEGIDEKLEKLTWKRFATGLFQPLGLKIVDGKVYVAGRDQITRLHDLNGDGEADWYENFNNDTVVTDNYHEFVLDLHTDPQGNFYFAKGSPWEPNVTAPQQGALLKVSPDGKAMDIFATGLRAPNGMTVGPDGTVLVSDNQGHWMPSSKVSLARKGSFLGMVPAAQRELTMVTTNGVKVTANPSDPAVRKQQGWKGWDKEMPIPVEYDEPVAWLPMRWDNSSGGQTYVTSDRWGPWKGAPLFLSYGKGLLYGMMWDNVGDTAQAALMPFDLKFNTGVMRARFNPKDGQLYLCGLKGWQCAATRDGGFYRVRYTGRPVYMPVAVRSAENGIALTFGTELSPDTATALDSWSAEMWNYRYSGNYGSPELSVRNPGKEGHDKLEVKSARLLPDKKTVFVELDGLRPCDQWSLKFNLDAADGTPMKSEVIGTIHTLRPAEKLVAAKD
ncbi:MAG: DUF6797 domain-containing protein [Limisphaerales bacterium]